MGIKAIVNYFLKKVSNPTRKIKMSGLSLFKNQL